MKKLLGLISFLLVLAGSVSAKVVLPAIFSDNMVLQQNAQVNLWGKATPGERVSVLSVHDAFTETRSPGVAFPHTLGV